jgi:hypothetical protein
LTGKKNPQPRWLELRIFSLSRGRKAADGELYAEGCGRQSDAGL